MNRKELQELSTIRIEEAKALLDKGLYDGAYYLCGYAVECALKACIAKNVKQYDFPDKKAVLDSYTHNVTKLAQVAILISELNQEKRRDSQFEVNWTLAERWSEESRYRKNTKAAAFDLYKAITDSKHGVIRWIRQYW
jgi:HEPN domain-containing protein